MDLIVAAIDTDAIAESIGAVAARAEPGTKMLVPVSMVNYLLEERRQLIALWDEARTILEENRYNPWLRDRLKEFLPDEE